MKLNFTPTRPILILVSIGLFLISFTSSFIFFRSRQNTSISIEPGNYQPLPPPVSPDPSQKTLGILLLGYGGPGHQGGYLTDVIQVVYFDFEQNRLAFISLPRDLYLKFPDGIPRKINAVFAAKTKDQPYPKEGLSEDQARTAFKDVKALVSGLTGLPIDYAIGIDFVGFQRLIGSVLEGVTINNPEPLDDAWYPIRGEELNPCDLSPEDIASLSATLSGFALEKQFPCRYERIVIPAGTQTLSGHDALAYVRSRHSSSDFARSRRQHALLIGLRDKLFSLQILDDLPQWYQALSQQVATDVNLDFVKSITGNLNAIATSTPVTINLSTENVFVSSKSSQGAFILLPKAGANVWGPTHSYIQSQLESATATSSAQSKG